MPKESSELDTRQMGKPKVSILLAVYNGAKYLPQTLDAVLGQTMDDWQLMVVDDGSTDNSKSMMRAYDDPRILCIEQANSGAAAAIDRGLAAATGEYIAFLDQDDLWEKEFLRKQIDKLESREDLQATFCWFRLIDSNGRSLGLHSQRYHGSVTFEKLIQDFVIGATSNVVMRREAIALAGGIDTAFRRMYDLDLFLRISHLQKGCIESIPEDLMLYRRHGSQMSSDYQSLLNEWELVFEKLRSLEPSVVGKYMPVAKSNAYRYFARVAYEQMQFRASIRLLSNGLLAAPSSFFLDGRNWITLLAALCGLLLPKRIHRRLEKMAGFHRGEGG